MRIAITGSPGVGKTTTAMRLATHLTQDTGHLYQLVGNIGKEVMTQWWNDPTIQHRLCPADLSRLLIEIVRRKLARESVTERFVADKSILGWLGELAIRCYQDIDWQLFRCLLEECIEHCRRYDAIFVLQHDSISFVDDKIRSRNKIYNLSLEIMERGLYEKYKIHVVDIHDVTLEDRVRTILSNVEGRRVLVA